MRGSDLYLLNPDEADRLRVTIRPIMPNRLDPIPAEAYVQVTFENLTWAVNSHCLPLTAKRWSYTELVRGLARRFQNPSMSLA